MVTLQASQIKAARAMLNWSQGELACKTGLSINTIRNLELGMISPRASTTGLIRETVEKAGFEFIESEGIRRIKNEPRVLSGMELITDILQTTWPKDEALYIILPSQKIFAQSLGLFKKTDIDRLIELDAAHPIKCMLHDIQNIVKEVLPFDFAVNPDPDNTPYPSITYSDKIAILLNDAANLEFVVVRSKQLVLSCRRQFEIFWQETKRPKLSGYKVSRI